MISDKTVDVGALIDAEGIGPAQWMIIVLCAFVALLDGLDLQSIGLAAPAIIQLLHIPPQAMGTVFAAALAGLTIGSFVMGWVADRVGRKTVLLGSTVVFGLFTLGTAFANSFEALLVIRFFAGVGLGGATPSFISLVSEYVPSKRRATVVSLLWAGFPLGGFVGGLLASHLIPAYGWHSIFVVGGTVPIIVALLLTFGLPESLAFMINRGHSKERIANTIRRMFPRVRIEDDAKFIFQRGETSDVSVRQLFADGRGAGTLLLWLAFFFPYLLLVTNSAWSPTLLGILGVPIQQSSFAMAMFNFGSLIGTAAAGALVTALGPSGVLSLALIGGAASFAAVGAVAPSITSINVAQAVVGLMLGCASSGLIAYSAIFYPASVRSTGVGWASAVGRFGSFLGPLIVAQLVAAHWPVPNIFMALAVSVLISAVACFLMRWAKPKQLIAAPAAE